MNLFHPVCHDFNFLLLRRGGSRRRYSARNDWTGLANAAFTAR